MVFLLSDALAFPPPERASAEGLVAPAVYAELAAWLLAHAPAQFNGALVDARQVPAASH